MESSEVPIEEQLHGFRIVTVDDNPMVLQLLAAFLRLCGAEVREARTGADALDLVAAWPPHVLVSDLSMPGLDGYELLQSLRRLAGPRRPIPVVALSGHSDPDAQERALGAGFAAFVPKPVDLVALVRAVLSTGVRPDLDEPTVGPSH